MHKFKSHMAMWWLQLIQTASQENTIYSSALLRRTRRLVSCSLHVYACRYLRVNVFLTCAHVLPRPALCCLALVRRRFTMVRTILKNIDRWFQIISYSTAAGANNKATIRAEEGCKDSRRKGSCWRVGQSGRVWRRCSCCDTETGGLHGCAYNHAGDMTLQR